MAMEEARRCAIPPDVFPSLSQGERKLGSESLKDSSRDSDFRQRRWHVRGWFFPVTMHFDLLVVLQVAAEAASLFFLIQS